MARGFPEAMRIIVAGVSEPSMTAPFRYSDTGFIVLAELVRRVSGEPLDRFTHKRFYQPLGMRDTTFNPPKAWRPRIAPTEFVQGQMLRGVVHDPRARELHGVAGHAGSSPPPMISGASAACCSRAARSGDGSIFLPLP